MPYEEYMDFNGIMLPLEKKNAVWAVVLIDCRVNLYWWRATPQRRSVHMTVLQSPLPYSSLFTRSFVWRNNYWHSFDGEYSLFVFRLPTPSWGLELKNIRSIQSKIIKINICYVFKEILNKWFCCKDTTTFFLKSDSRYFLSSCLQAFCPVLPSSLF